MLPAFERYVRSIDQHAWFKHVDRVHPGLQAQALRARARSLIYAFDGTATAEVNSALADDDSSDKHFIQAARLESDQAWIELVPEAIPYAMVDASKVNGIGIMYSRLDKRLAKSLSGGVAWNPDAWMAMGFLGCKDKRLVTIPALFLSSPTKELTEGRTKGDLSIPEGYDLTPETPEEEWVKKHVTMTLFSNGTPTADEMDRILPFTRIATYALALAGKARSLPSPKATGIIHSQDAMFPVYRKAAKPKPRPVVRIRLFLDPGKERPDGRRARGMVLGRDRGPVALHAVRGHWKYRARKDGADPHWCPASANGEHDWTTNVFNDRWQTCDLCRQFRWSTDAHERGDPDAAPAPRRIYDVSA